MENIFYILLWFLFPLAGSSQNTYDDIRLSVCGNSPKIFYEGQCFFVTVCVENLSTIEKQYDQGATLHLYFENFNNVVTKEKIENQFAKRIHYDIEGFHGSKPKQTPSPQIKSEVIVNKAFQPKGKYNISLYLESWGNRTMSDILGLPDSVFYKPIFPQYLSPGKYQITLKVTLEPGGHLIKTLHEFEVLPAEGKIREDMLGYLNAYKKDFDFNHVINKMPTYPKTVEKPNLYYFLTNHVESIYATEVCRLLDREYTATPENIRIFEENFRNTFELFEILPKIKSYPSDKFAYDFLSKNQSSLNLFADAGMIGDLREYADDYLKKIQHYGPHVSEIFIYYMKNFYNLKGLENYALKNSKK